MIPAQQFVLVFLNLGYMKKRQSQNHSTPHSNNTADVLLLNLRKFGEIVNVTCQSELDIKDMNDLQVLLHIL